MKKPYIHDEGNHNIEVSADLAKNIYQRFSPSSVVDVGCGTGNFLKAFKELGVNNVLGYDGDWGDYDQRQRYLSDEEFETINLESLSPVTVGAQIPQFDIAICLEVAEHLNAKSAPGLIDFLVSLSDTVIFSAAIPNQPGQNHVNCQWPEYWGELFRARGFITFDNLRATIWNNEAIPWWYRQNLFLACREGSTQLETLTSQPVTKLQPLVHPRLLDYHIQHVDCIIEGQYPINGYISMLRKKFKSTFGI
ncbi:MAG: methyltransferase domain-containing protein [Gimesia sp.]